MNVYKVITERLEGKEIIQTNNFVSATDLQIVANYFAKHCEEYELDLISVSYAVTVTQHIEEDKQD